MLEKTSTSSTSWIWFALFTFSREEGLVNTGSSVWLRLIKTSFFSRSRNLCDLYFRVFIWKTVSPIHLKACSSSDWKFRWEIPQKCHFLKSYLFQNRDCIATTELLIYINPDFLRTQQSSLDFWFRAGARYKEASAPACKQNYKKWNKIKGAKKVSTD